MTCMILAPDNLPGRRGLAKGDRMGTQRRQSRRQSQERDMSEHVVFRDMRPEDVKVITFGEPGSLIDRIDRPDVCLLYTSPSPRD